MWEIDIELSSTAEAMNSSRSPRTNLSSYVLTFKKGGLCRAIHIVKKGLAMMGDDIRETSNTTYKECGS